MKYKYLFHPEDFCLGENERFYAEQAAAGWRLEHRGRYLSGFERAEPAEEMYRIEVDSWGMTQEQLSIYADCGWEYVTGCGYVHVFRSPAGSGAPEFYSDPAEQARTLRRMRRRSMIGGIVIWLLLIPYIALILDFNGGVDAAGAGLVRSLVRCPELTAFWVVMLLYGVAQDLESSLRFHRMIRRLKAGKNLDHAPKRRRMIHAYAITAFALVCLGVFIAQLVVHDKREMPAVSDGPYVVLSELGFDGERRGIMDEAAEAWVARDWSPLCDSVEADEVVDASEGTNYVWLKQAVVDLRVPALAESYARALIYDSYNDEDPEEYEEIAVPGWDLVLVAYRELYAVSGGRVVSMQISLPGMFRENGVTEAEIRETMTRVLTGIGTSY